MNKDFYTFKSLAKDLFKTRLTPKVDKKGRIVWGTDPYDLGEGITFLSAGEELFEPRLISEDFLVPLPNLEDELKMINLAIEKAIKESVCQDMSVIKNDFAL